MSGQEPSQFESDAIAAWVLRDAGAAVNSPEKDSAADSAAEQQRILARCDAATELAPKLAARPDLAWAFREARELARSGPVRRPGPEPGYARPALAWSVAGIALAGWLGFAIGAMGLGSDTEASGPAQTAPGQSTSAGATSGPASVSGFALAPVGVPAGIEARLAAIDPVVWVTEERAIDNRLIAVLPFSAAPSADSIEIAGIDALASTIHGRLLQQLAAISGLYVVDPIVAAAYAESDLTVAQIAEYLNVRGVLEGRIDSNGERIRISLRFNDVARGSAATDTAFERPVGELGAIQDQITELLIGALSVPNTSLNDTML